MLRFINALERTVEDVKVKSAHNFEAKVTVKILRYYGINHYEDTSDSEFGLEYFHTQCPSFPIQLVARNIKININQMFKSITKTEVWKMFINYLDENELSYAAFIIPCFGQGLYALHNCYHLEQMPGYTRLVRQSSTSSEKGIILEPLEAFLGSIKKAGWQA